MTLYQDIIKKLIKMNDDGGIVINDMPGVHHVVYPDGFKLDAKALDPNIGGLAPKGEKVR